MPTLTETDALPTLAEHDSLDAIGIRIAGRGHDYRATLHRANLDRLTGDGTTDYVAVMRLADRLRRLADEIDQAIDRRPAAETNVPKERREAFAAGWIACAKFRGVDCDVDALELASREHLIAPSSIPVDEDEE